MIIMQWQTIKKHRGVVFSKLPGYGNIHHGVSPFSLSCYIIERHYTSSVGSSGYVIVPLSLISDTCTDVNSDSDSDSDSDFSGTDSEPNTSTELKKYKSPLRRAFDMFEDRDGNVHGGITYVKSSFPASEVNIGNDVIVVGFDTSHAFSPRYVNIEFMIEEVLKLAKWCHETATNTRIKRKLYKTEKPENYNIFLI
jgi:hypothetical protein